MVGLRQRLGSLGERVAAAHLEAKGYRIRERNFRTREGEIDLVAEHRGTVVLVEVRTRRGDGHGGALESVTPEKQARLRTLADAYCAARGVTPEQVRIDVVGVTLMADGRLGGVEHVENAVEGR